MFIIIGFVITIGCVLGGFMAMGGLWTSSCSRSSS